MPGSGKPWAKVASCVTYFLASSAMVLCNKGAVGIVSSMWGLVLFQNLVSVALYLVGGALGLVTMASKNVTEPERDNETDAGKKLEEGKPLENGKSAEKDGATEEVEPGRDDGDGILLRAIMMAPSNVLFVVMHFSSMQSLHHLSVPMVMVLKNLSNILTIPGDWYYHGEKLNLWVGISAGLIVLGAICAGMNDLGLNTWGCIWMGVNTVCTAAFNLYLKRCHNTANLTSVGMAAYNTCLSIPTILLVWSIELMTRDGNLAEMYNVTSIVANSLIREKIVLFLSGGIGTILGAAGMWCIAETSPTTYAFVSAMDKVGVSIVGALLFGSLITSQGWIFVWMNMAGGMLYVASRVGVLKERKGINTYIPAGIIIYVIFLPLSFSTLGELTELSQSDFMQNLKLHQDANLFTFVNSTISPDLNPEPSADLNSTPMLEAKGSDKVIQQILNDVPFDCSALSEGRPIRNLNVVFTSICMNGEGELPRSANLIEAMGSCFKDYDVVIVENDSQDNTKAALRAWKSRNKRVILETRDYRKRKRPAIQWLADLRNKAMHIAYTLSYSTNIRHDWSADLYIVVDMDLVAVDLAGFVEAAEAVAGGTKPAPVGGVCNGVYDNWRYRDIFAFRSCNLRWDMRKGPMFLRMYNRGPLDSIVFNAQRTYTADLPPFPVDSAFSGIGVYRADAVFGPLDPSKPAVWMGHTAEPAFRMHKTGRYEKRFNEWSLDRLGVFPNYSYAIDIGAQTDFPCMYGSGGLDDCEHVTFTACLNARATTLGLSPVHLFPKFGVWYGPPDAKHLPVDKIKLRNGYPEYWSVPIPYSKPDQPYHWVGPEPLQCNCDLFSGKKGHWCPLKKPKGQ